MLDDLLQYHESVPEDDFALRVVKQIMRQQRQRRLILACSGVVGAAFGIIGMATLSQPLAQWMEQANALPMSLGLIATGACIFWLLQDEADAVG